MPDRIGSAPPRSNPTPDASEPASTPTDRAPSAPRALTATALSAGTRGLVQAFQPSLRTFLTSPGNRETTASGKPASNEQTQVLRALEWGADKVGSEAACATLPCDRALWSARIVMPDHGLGEHMLDHFLSGSSKPVKVDLNRLLDANPRLKELVASRIEFDLAKQHARGADVEQASGAIWISQADYGDTTAGKDQKYALGGTFFEYQVTGSSDTGGLEVTLHIADHYAWTPSDATRPTQCLHECGAQLVSQGRATEFFQYGEGTLSVADPRSGDVPLPPAYPPGDPR